ncbi:MAG: aquaporin [Bdellovibrionales bacterium]|nr:aquaporin [Bdellovibrionales bacterium]
MLKALAPRALAESLGTFSIVFLGCGAMRASEILGLDDSALPIPIVFGLTVAVMIYALGHVSGAHFNPAVTLGFVASRHLPLREAPAYWAAQFAGAGLAVLALALLLPGAAGYGAAVTHLDPARALGWEFLLTFFLMFVIAAVATDKRAHGALGGAAIGATVAIGSWVGGPLTRAAMNPARALAPALAEGHFGNLWIYFLGPCLGAVAAALLYRWIREQR